MGICDMLIYCYGITCIAIRFRQAPVHAHYLARSMAKAFTQWKAGRPGIFLPQKVAKKPKATPTPLKHLPTSWSQGECYQEACTYRTFPSHHRIRSQKKSPSRLRSFARRSCRNLPQWFLKGLYLKCPCCNIHFNGNSRLLKWRYSLT